MEAAIIRRGNLVETRIRESLEAESDPAEAVRSFVLKVAELVVESDFEQGGPLITLALEVAGFSDRLTDACREAYQSWQQVFADKRRNRLNSDQETERLAHLILCAIEGGIVLSRTRRSGVPLKDVAGELRILIRHHTEQG